MSKHRDRPEAGKDLATTGYPVSTGEAKPLLQFLRRVLAVDAPVSVPPETYRQGYRRHVGMVIPVSVSTLLGISEVDISHAYLAFPFAILMLVGLALAYRRAVVKRPQWALAYAGWRNVSRWLAIGATFYLVGLVIGALFLPDNPPEPGRSTWLLWALVSIIYGVSGFHTLREPFHGRAARWISWFPLILFGVLMPLVLLAIALSR